MNTSATARLASLVTLLFAGLLTLSACKKNPPSDSDGHDHSSSKTSESAKEGHDHAAPGGDEHVDEVKLTAESIERYGIKVDTAHAHALKPTIVVPARVAFNAEAMAHIGSPLRGRAVEIKARLGDSVKKGDPLLIIESPELGEAQADYFQKRTAVQTAGPGIDLARIAWERAKGLHEQSQGISLTEVQRREAEYKAATANQKAADSSVVSAENHLRLLGMSQAAISQLAQTGEIAPRHTITAPIDGQIIQREVTLGELVGPDRDEIMVLADVSTLWVLADVPESRLGEVAPGAKAWITIGTADKKVEGQVAFIASQVDAATRTAQVRIEVSATAMTLKPGMFAQVEIVMTSAAGAEQAPTVAVPAEAVQTVEGGPAIFVPVKDEPNTFAKRPVTVGKSVGGLIPIYSGLAQGEQFVTAGTFLLKAELGKEGAAHEH